MTSSASSNLSTIVGRNIVAARAEAGMTQRQLAVRLNCEGMLVSKWERGLHSPSTTNLQALAAVFDRSPGWFYTDHGNGDRGPESEAA